MARSTDRDDPRMPREAEILADLEQSEREIAAGLLVPFDTVMAELEAVANAIERKDRAAA